MEAVRERFAAENNLKPAQLRELMQLANAAEASQVKEHNRRNWDSKNDIEAFERMAKKLGFIKVRWPGLWPQVSKDGKTFLQLPE